MTSFCLGLSLGESFAEIVGIDAHSATSSPKASKDPLLKNQHAFTLGPVRWYLPRKSVTDGLKEVLSPALELGGTLYVTTSLAGTAFDRKLGTTPAALVTAGLEPWLGLQTPNAISEHWRAPIRSASPLNEDHVFSITERIRADGSIETPLALEDLEFLISKLELLKTRTIAVAFLHSDRNPTHENQIAEFFRGRGFEVFCSHQYALEGDRTRGELSRWKRVAHAAYVQSALNEQKESVIAALGEHAEKWNVQFVNALPSRPTLAATPGFQTALGLTEGLAYAAGLNESSNKVGGVFHFGLEHFVMALTGRGEFMVGGEGSPHLAGARQHVPKTQPTSLIGRGFWPLPLANHLAQGFESSPMAMGKSQQPTVTDTLFALERIQNIPGFDEILVAKTRPRILDAIFTMAKGLPGTNHSDASRMAADVETSVIESLHSDLLLSGAEGEILLSGALAKTFHPRLKARRPDLKFQLSPMAEWGEALGTALLGLALSDEPKA